MNKNKGFIGIGLIIVIVLGVVIIAGGAYYLGNNNPKLKDDWKGIQKNLKEQEEKSNQGDHLLKNENENENEKVFNENIKVSDTSGEVEEESNIEEDKVLSAMGEKKEDKTTPVSSSTSTESNDKLKTYTNKEYGIEFKYSPSSIIKESVLPNGMYPEGGYGINLSVPFIDKYDSWTSKSIDIIITKSNCIDYLPNSILEKKIINGVSYLFQDPDWTATSGMSSISKWRKYFYESSDKCYMINEGLRGLGNNERPSTYTFPSDVNKFLDSELADLDKIIESIKLF